MEGWLISIFSLMIVSNGLMFGYLLKISNAQSEFIGQYIEHKLTCKAKFNDLEKRLTKEELPSKAGIDNKAFKH